MEFNTLLEIIVLVVIIIEIYSLARHSKLEHRVEEHIKQLDEHIVMLDRHLNIHNSGSEDRNQEP